ncbi:MAG: hypothetical protein ACLVJH_15195 [Faecalibacterium prausnitzii]
MAFKLCAALDGCPPEEMLDYCGDLAAVGTVADVMPLAGRTAPLSRLGCASCSRHGPPRLLEALSGRSGPCGQAGHRRKYQLRHRAPHQRGGPHGQRCHRFAAGAL